MKFVLSFLLTAIAGMVSAQTFQNRTGSSITIEQAQASLDFNNKIRKEVDVPPLEWSTELSAYAQAWADQLDSMGCKPKHRPYTGEWKQQYGENIFWGSHPKFDALYATENWYNEINSYIHGPLRQEVIPKVGHYTQMVWSTTTKVGYGIANCENGGVIIVANYSPAGNYIGEKAY